MSVSGMSELTASLDCRAFKSECPACKVFCYNQCDLSFGWVVFVRDNCCQWVLLHCENAHSLQKHRFRHIVPMVFPPINTCRWKVETIRELLVLTPWAQGSWQPGPVNTWIPGAQISGGQNAYISCFGLFLVRFFASSFQGILGWYNYTTISLHVRAWVIHVLPKKVGFWRGAKISRGYRLPVILPPNPPPSTQATPTQSSSHYALNLYWERGLGQWKWLMA